MPAQPCVLTASTDLATETTSVDRGSLSAGAGQVVVVPAGATHGFRNAGGEVVEMLSIHPVAEMRTEWMEAS